MELLEHYLSLATKTIFIENILLSYFLGMCSFLAISKKIEASIGLGFAVIFVSGVTVPLNWAIKEYLLNEGALTWVGISELATVDLSFLSFVTYIATIAAMVQLVEMLLDKFSPVLYNSLGIFLPLIGKSVSLFLFIGCFIPPEFWIHCSISKINTLYCSLTVLIIIHVKNI